MIRHKKAWTIARLSIERSFQPLLGETELHFDPS